MASRKRRRGCEGEGSITKYFRVANLAESAAPIAEDTGRSVELTVGRPNPTTGEDNTPSDDHINDVSDNDDKSGESERDDSVAGPSRKADSSISDLGLVIRESMTNSEVSTAVLGLTPGQKYTLLTSQEGILSFRRFSTMAVIDPFNYSGWINIHG